jgi:hypothetical protein
MVAQSDAPDDVPGNAPGAGGRPAPGRAADGRGGDPTASDPTVGALSRLNRTDPAGTAPEEEDRMRNRAW